MVVKNVKFTRAEIRVLACFTLDNIKPSIIAKILNNSVRTIYAHLNQIKRKANIQTIDDIPLFIKSSKEFNKLKVCFNSQYIDYYFRIMAKKIKNRLSGLSITCPLITPSESANNKIINEIIELIELTGIHVKQDNYTQPINDVLNKNDFHLFIYRNINEIEKSAKTLTQNSLSLVLDAPPNSKQLLRENNVIFFDKNNKKEFYKFFVDYLLKNYHDSINISEIKNFSASIDNITSNIQYDFFKNLPNSNTSKNKLTKFNYFLISTLVICMLLGINYWYNRDTNGFVDIHSVNTKNLRAVKAWYLPYRNNKFTGREGIFKTIKNNLDKSNIGIITQSISGVGGIGKTQLATEYAYRAIENREYDIILWVTAESQNSINSSYDAFASKLTINSHGLQPEQLRKIVHNKLLNEYKVNKILFIFDNVPQEKNFQQYLTELHNQFPISTQLHVLITSRSQHWTEDALILDVFAEQEAKEFIKKHLSNENEQDIIKLTKALHYFPLALGQAVGYIKQHTNIVDYLQLYESNQLQFLNIPPKDNNQYIKSLWQTTIISLDKLSSQAKRILYISSYLEPDNIQLELFRDVPIAIKSSAIQELRKYSLIILANNGKSFKVHRLLQEVIRLTIKENPKWINETIQIANKDKEFFSIKNEDSWSIARKWLSHTTILSQYMPQNLDKANFLYEYGKIATYVGLYDLAYEYYIVALEIKETYYQDHIEIADILNSMGRLETSLQNHKKAKKLLERALKIKQSYYQNHTHIEMADILHNLGRVGMGMGNYKEARKLLQQALEIKESYRQDNDHVELADILESIGRLETLTENQIEAKKLLQRALKIKEIYYQKPEHIALTGTLSELGVVECTLGNFEKAKEIFQQTLRMVKTYYNDSSHINLAHVLNNLGIAEFYLGNYEEAEKLLEQSLGIIKIYYRDPLHVVFVLPLYYLGLTAEGLGNYTIALKYLSQSYDIQNKYYQNGLYEAMAYIYAPGSVWPKLSKHNQNMAVKYYQKILIIGQELFGDNYNFAAHYHYLLGQAYEATAKIKSAIQQYKKSLYMAIEIDKNIKNHDIRLKHQKNITSIKNKLGELEKDIHI